MSFHVNFYVPVLALRPESTPQNPQADVVVELVTEVQLPFPPSPDQSVLIEAGTEDAPFDVLVTALPGPGQVVWLPEHEVFDVSAMEAVFPTREEAQAFVAQALSTAKWSLREDDDGDDGDDGSEADSGEDAQGEAAQDEHAAQ